MALGTLDYTSNSEPGFNSQVGGGQISHGFDIYLYQAP